MTTYHVYGKLYCRSEVDHFEGTVTEDQLKAIASYVDDSAGDQIAIEVEDLLEENYDVIDMLITGFGDEAIVLEDVLAATNYPVALEEYCGGIGVSETEAKLGWCAAEAGLF